MQFCQSSIDWGMVTAVRYPTFGHKNHGEVAVWLFVFYKLITNLLFNLEPVKKAFFFFDPQLLEVSDAATLPPDGLRRALSSVYNAQRFKVGLSAKP